MSNKDIIRITKINNVQLENIHNGFVFPMQNVLEVENREGAIRILDLIADRDITDIEYFIVHETSKTTRKNLFIEYKDE